MMLTAQHQRADSHDKDQRNIASRPKIINSRTIIAVLVQTRRVNKVKINNMVSNRANLVISLPPSNCDRSLYHTFVNLNV